MWLPAASNRPAKMSKSPCEVSDAPDCASRMLPLKSPMTAHPPPGKAATDFVVAVLPEVESPQFLLHWHARFEARKSRMYASALVAEAGRLHASRVSA